MWSPRRISMDALLTPAGPDSVTVAAISAMCNMETHGEDLN
jgi:hypothetical protein